MENILTIAYLVFVLLGIIASIISTVVTVKRKKAKGEQINAEEVVSDIAGKVIGLVKTAESVFSGVNKGGALKLKDVLNDTKALCENSGITFDKNYWTDFISKAVELINIARQSGETSPDAITETK